MVPTPINKDEITMLQSKLHNTTEPLKEKHLTYKEHVQIELFRSFNKPMSGNKIAEKRDLLHQKFNWKLKMAPFARFVSKSNMAKFMSMNTISMPSPILDRRCCMTRFA